MLTRQSYVFGRLRRGHSVSSAFATALVVTMWGATWVGERLLRTGGLRIVSLVLLSVVFVCRAPRVVVIAAAVLAGVAGGASAWGHDVVDSAGRCDGHVTLLTDPAPAGAGIRVVVGQGNRRLAASAFGVPGRILAQRSAGDRVRVTAFCTPLDSVYARRERIRHVVGRMSVETVSERFAEPSVVVRSANRVRTAMSQGVSRMDASLRSLFTGLVVGDDRLQSRQMVSRFRESGLSHLCAASGQNVAYLLALAGPLLRRRTARVRLLLTLAVIAWFVVLTRAEPSVLRAGFMAAAVAVNAARRTPVNARVVLAVSAMCLLAVDPMLAWNVGFALSVGATAGLAWLSAPLGKVLGGRGVLAATLAAQIGTLPVSLAVFGSVPVVSLVANPLALPVAGAVMTVGLPLSLLASAFPVLVVPVSSVLSVPVLWVDTVARVCSGVSVGGVMNWFLWAVVAVWVVNGARRHRSRRTHVAG